MNLGCRSVVNLVWRNTMMMLFSTLRSIARNEQGGGKTTIILALVMTTQHCKKVDGEM